MAKAKKQEILDAFDEEFKSVKDKYCVFDILKEISINDTEAMRTFKYPSEEHNAVPNAGVYVFIGDEKVYRVGKAKNSRARVLSHLKEGTGQNRIFVNDIGTKSNPSILFFNILNSKDSHWNLALEAYLEKTFNPLIPAKRRE